MPSEFAQNSMVMRGIMLGLATIVLSLSIHIFSWQQYNSVPWATLFALAVTVWGFSVALVGIASIWLEPLAGIVTLVLECLTIFIYITGGIVFLVKLGDIGCIASQDINKHNEIITGGCIYHLTSDQYQCGTSTLSTLQHRCSETKANGGLMNLAGLLNVVVAAFSSIAMHNKRT